MTRRVANIGSGAGAQVKVDTAEVDAKIAKIKAELADIAKTKLAVALDTAAADAKLVALNAEARKLRDDLKSGKVDLDVDAAKARLAEIAVEIGGIRDTKAQVKVDTAESNIRVATLKDELDEATRDRRTKIDVDTAAARAEIAALKADAANIKANASNDTGSGGGGLSTGGLGLGLGFSFLPALIPAAAAAIPVIGGIGSALAGAAAGGGVLKAAFSGIGDAVTALGAKNNQTGQQIKAQAAQQLAAANGILNAQDAVANSVRALANAQAAADQQKVQSAEQVKNAQQAETDARRSAALSEANAQQSLVGAEQSYTSSLYTERQAQLSLDQARKQAAQTLQDLSNQVKDGSLSQRQATIDLQSAMDNLKVIDFNPHSTQQQRAEAQLQVDQAKQHLSELELANSRLAAQKATADKLGVSGAPAVVAAEHAVATATDARKSAYDGVARAQAAVVEAQRAGAESIAKAEQGVTDALRQQAIQAASSQQAILSAQQGIVSSQRSLAQAYASAGAQGSAANDAVASAMAGLTPAGVAFARFVNDRLKPALKTITDSAQQGFLPGFQKALTILLPYMPGFAKFAGDIARELGNMAVSAATALQSPFWKQFGTFLADLAKSSLPVLGQILGNLVTGFAGLFEAIAPAGDGVGGGLVTITKAFSDWATHLGTNAGFQKFLQYVKDNSPAVGKFFVDLAVVVGKLIIALAPLGALLAVGLENLVAALAKLSPAQLIGIAAGIGAIAIGITIAVGGPIAALIVGVTAIAGALVYAYTHFKTFHDIADAVMKDVATVYKYYWEYVIHPMLKAFGDVVTFLWFNVLKPTFGWISDHWIVVATAMQIGWDKVMHPVLHAFGDVLTFLWQNVISPTLDYISKNWSQTGDNFKSVYDNVISPVWDAMESAFKSTGSAFGKFRDGLSTVWTDIRKTFATGVDFITQNVLNKFINAINAVTGVFNIPKIPAIPKLGSSASGSTAGASAGSASGGGGGNKKSLAFAHGGVAPGYAPGQDILHAMVSPGEGFIVPEAVVGLGGAPAIHAINRFFSNRPASSDGRHFAGGGVAGAVAGAVNPVGNVLGHLFGNAATGAALDAAEAPIKAVLDSLAPPIIKTLGAGAFAYIDKAVRAFMGGHPSSGSNIGPAPVGSAGGAARWAPIILQVLGMLGIPGSALGGIESLINHESGGNPNAINLTDSNAMAGHPSQGLMQTIPTTFAAYAGQFASRGITDPLANIYAGTNYALHRYGVDMLAAGGRHDANGNYIGYDSGGYLQPGVTQVYNGTGKPEPVFTDDQWAKLSAGHRAADGGRPSLQQTNHFYEQTDPQQAATETARRIQFASSI